MAQQERAVFTNMCMVCDGNGNVLVQDRADPNWPGITFPGGHVEKGESFVASVIREVKEETGLDIEAPVLCGVKQFQTDDDARYVVLLFKTDRYHGELASSSEGEVFWVPREKLSEYTLVNDFEDMVRVFESDSLNEFFYDRSDRDKEDWIKHLL